METRDDQNMGAPRNWLAEFDGLRFVAALTVAIVHYTPVTAPFRSVPVWLRSRGDELSIANLSVALFYGLSAFLLTYLELLRRQSGRPMSVTRFYLRRILRIWPLYFSILALGLVLMAPKGPSVYSGEDLRSGWRWGVEHIWMYLTLTSNWSLVFNGIGSYINAASSNLDILWSIAVEEQFYLLFPIFLLLCFRRPGLWIKLAITALFFGLASRATLVWTSASFSSGGSGGYIYYATSSYVEVFVAGALAAAVYTDSEGSTIIQRLFRRPIAGLALIGALLCLGLFWRPSLFPPYAKSASNIVRIAEQTRAICIYPMLGCVIAAVLLWVLINPNSTVSRALRTRPLRALGSLSFGLYLWHPLVQPLIRTIDHLTVTAMPAQTQVLGANLLFLLYLSLSLMCAAITYFLIEAPVLRWKQRFAGNSAGVLAPERNTALVLPPVFAAGAFAALLISSDVLYPAGPAAPAIQVQHNLQPVGPPPPVPEGLRSQPEASAGSVLLDWRPVEGIDHFEIEQLELRTGGLGRQQIVGAPSSNHTYRFQNLVLDAAYRFRIRACSKSVCSDWSPPTTSSSIQRHEAQ